jgi:hypothetical protein
MGLRFQSSTILWKGSRGWVSFWKASKNSRSLIWSRVLSPGNKRSFFKISSPPSVFFYLHRLKLLEICQQNGPVRSPRQTQTLHLHQLNRLTTLHFEPNPSQTHVKPRSSNDQSAPRTQLQTQRHSGLWNLLKQVNNLRVDKSRGLLFCFWLSRRHDAHLWHKVDLNEHHHWSWGCVWLEIVVKRVKSANKFTNLPREHIHSSSGHKQRPNQGHPNLAYAQ